jgi:hypothetical protein
MKNTVIDLNFNSNSHPELFKVYIQKVDEANKLNLIHFVFDFESKYYMVYWIKNNWSYPVLIDKL